ncbi:MAG: thioredoxin [Beijerinckiaceae bacterium]|nr:thioredoxin [Beijerinckiaceae bacterium]
MQINAKFGSSTAAPQASLQQASTTQASAAPPSLGLNAAAGDLVKDTTTAAFRADVIAESARQPVLVDFWAPWCGPCKQLTPILERQVQAARGKVKLVKMNIDEHPQISGQLGIKSIPAVIAFVNGQPVDGFMGSLPESQVKSFIDRISGPGGDPLEDALAEAEELVAAGDTPSAMQLYAMILAEAPDSLKAVAGLARLHVDLGDLDAARQVLDAAPAGAEKDAGVQSVRAAIDLAEREANLGDLQDLEARVAASPDDHAARLEYAVALSARNKRDEAVDQLIEIIRKDRAWNDDAARKQLLQFFEAWGFKDEASVTGRRKLSAILFA